MGSDVSNWIPKWNESLRKRNLVVKIMSMEFQYLKIPYGESALALLGSEWIKEYGLGEDVKECKKTHFHNLMEIAICRMGTGEIYFEHEKFEYKKDDVLIIPRNFSHTIISHSGEKSFWEYIYLKPSVLLEKVYNAETRKKMKLLEEIEYRPFLKSKKDAGVLITELDLIMDQYRRKEYEYKISIDGLLLALLLEIARINHKDHEKPEFEKKTNPEKVEVLGVALDYIEENFAKDLRISDISQAAYVSETYLRKLFMECCSVSPMHYAKMIRIEHACELLKKKDVNINEVAFQVGYTNLSTFINNFKCITGETPKQWKQNKKKKTLQK